MVGIADSDLEKDLIVYPNPTKGECTIELGREYQNVSLKVSGYSGKLISSHNFGTTSSLQFELKGSKGLYFVEIYSSEGKIATTRIIKD